MTLITMTLRDFRERICDHLASLPGDTEIYFGQGDLTFYRTKIRRYRADHKTPSLVQIDFGEDYTVDIDPETDD